VFLLVLRDIAILLNSLQFHGKTITLLLINIWNNPRLKFYQYSTLYFAAIALIDLQCEIPWADAQWFHHQVLLSQTPVTSVDGVVVEAH
jgi:hypothetical protein